MYYFMRHGLDDERFIGGHSDVALTEQGINQVQQAIEFIKEHDLQIRKIYTSDIYRAKQTADLIGTALDIPIVIDSRLREQDKGVVNGLVLEEAKGLFPLHFKNIKIEDTYPEGESYLDMYQRMISLFKSFDFENNSLIVTHRGPINCCYFYCNNQKPDMNKKQFEVTHASIHIFNPTNNSIRKIF